MSDPGRWLRRGLALCALALTACGEDAGGEAAPVAPPAASPGAAAEVAPAEAPSAAADAEPATRTDSFNTGPRRWTPATVATLQPVPPTRSVFTPAPLASNPRYDKTLATLRDAVTKHAGDPDNPWAIGHGLLAMGPDFVLSNSQPAVDWIFSQYAEELPLGDAAGDYRAVVFPRSRGEQRIEPHAGLMLKALTEIGVAPDKAVTVQGQPHTVADLYRGVLMSSYLVPERNHASFESPNDVPWALQGLATWAPPDTPLLWRTPDGTDMALSDLTAFSASVLIQESQGLFRAMEAGAEFEKRGQGIFKYTCGGSHLLQGTAYSVARGNGTEVARSGMTGQAALMFYRLPVELLIYDRLMERAPQHMLLLLVQRLKFLGHYLETQHRLAALGFYAPTAKQKELLEGAATQLVLLVEAMEERAIFDAMDALRTEQEQVYLDLIGDSAHAINGLEIALGRRPIRY